MLGQRGEHLLHDESASFSLIVVVYDDGIDVVFPPAHPTGSIP